MQKTERKFRRGQSVEIVGKANNGDTSAIGKVETVCYCYGRGHYEVAPHRDSPDSKFRTFHARALRAV